MMTGIIDNCIGNGQRTPSGAVELVEDLWLIIMSQLPMSDVLRLSQTCKTLYKYSQCRSIWHGLLVQHYFLPKNYPYLLYSPTNVIRRQLITTARLDAAFSKGTLKPTRSYSFPIDVPGLFQGLTVVPGSDWLVLLFHSHAHNSARESNICLFKPPMLASYTTNTTPASVTLQSEWCWKYTPKSGPYKSSQGDNLMLLQASVGNEQRFAICHLDTKTPSVKITFMDHSTLPLRNHTVSGNYFVYGWITNDSKHMVRIMKLNDDYTKLAKDVVVEIDAPQLTEEGWMLHYDLRLSGAFPKLLLVTTRLMAAYDISDAALLAGCQSSLKLKAVWKYVPDGVTFSRIQRVFHESAIVTTCDRKFNFIYPEIDDLEPNAKTIATYQFSPTTSYSTRNLSVFTSQRIFWPPCLLYSLLVPDDPNDRHLIRAAMIPAPGNSKCEIERVLVEHEELGLETGNLAPAGLHWDELSGKLCTVSSKLTHTPLWGRTGWRVTLMEMV